MGWWWKLIISVTFLKVSKHQKQNTKFSHPPKKNKKQWNFVKKKGLKPKIKALNGLD